MNKLKSRFLNRSPHVMSVCLPTHPPTYLSIYQSIHQSIYVHLTMSILHSENAPYDPVQRIVSYSPL